MQGIGLREWVALGVLGVGLVLGALFFGPLSNDGGGDGPSPIQLAPTATPTVPPTPTPVPPVALAEPEGSWFMRWFERSSTGAEVRIGEGFVEELALDLPGRPFADTRDDAWRREATQALRLEPGRYTFTLETDGAVRVLLEQTVLLEATDQPQAVRHEITFEHPGGGPSLFIEVRDTGGPTLLRWVD